MVNSKDRVHFAMLLTLRLLQRYGEFRDVRYFSGSMSGYYRKDHIKSKEARPGFQGHIISTVNCLEFGYWDLEF
jgi:hypothetical protein